MTIQLKRLPKIQLLMLAWLLGVSMEPVAWLLLGVSMEPAPHLLLRVSMEPAPCVPAQSHPSAGWCRSANVSLFTVSEVRLMASSHQVKYSLGAFGVFLLIVA